MTRKPSQREREIEEAAARWLARRDAGLSAAEAAEFEQWQLADPRHAAAVEEFGALWARLGRPRNAGVAAGFAQELATLGKRRRRRMATAASFAAIVMVAGCLGLRWFTTNETPSARATVLIAERRVLPDGSTVELKENAAIAVRFESGVGGRRHVVLQSGEAYFRVAKDEHRPFVVTTGGINVRAVGTEFSVQRRENQIEVFVAEGTVAVGKPEPEAVESTASPELVRAPTFVTAGHGVMMDPAATNDPEVRPLAANELDQRLAWRSPRVEFSRATLPEVVAVVNRYNTLQFRIADPDLEHLTVSGLFRADDPTTLAAALERTFGLRAERTSEREIVLTGASAPARRE